jgi:hypothetical protein
MTKKDQQQAGAEMPVADSAIAAVEVDQQQAPVVKARRALTSRSSILDANDLKTEEVDTPEWGEGTFVLVRNLTAEGRGMFLQRTMETARRYEVEKVLAEKENRQPNPFDDDKETEAFMCVLCICNEAGEPIMSLDDVHAMALKSAAPIMRIAQVAQKLSSLGQAAQTQAVKT